LMLTLSICRRSEKMPDVPEDLSALALSFQIGLIGVMVAEFFLTAQYIKEVWVLISLAPNLYAISLQAAATRAKTVSAQAERATPIVLRPRLRNAG